MVDPLATFGSPPERVESHFKIVEKPLCSPVFLIICHLEPLWGGSQAAFGVLEKSCLALTSLKWRTSATILVFANKSKMGYIC